VISSLRVVTILKDFQFQRIDRRDIDEPYHYNLISEPFTTSIIWGRWGRQMAGDAKRPQMAVSEPPLDLGKIPPREINKLTTLYAHQHSQFVREKSN
jgi:hypothetical protein